jgi:tetratricopeptide (TPR) repeat protein
VTAGRAASVRWWSAAAGAVLAGCAQVPAPTESPAPPPPVPRPALTAAQAADAVAKHRKLADAARQSGDLAGAAAQLQILALLVPDDPAVARELATTRATIATQARAEVAAGTSALAANDLDRATQAMLRALALDPAQPDAAKALREIDRRRFTRIQADRAAKVTSLQDQVAMTAAQRAQASRGDAGDGYDVEQAIEMFRAGDTTGGLRDLKAYVDANPGNRAARQRIATIVADRARELENQGQREPALSLYEQATALRGDANGAWAARMPPLRRELSLEYFEKGMRAYRTDLGQAVTFFQASVRFDPANAQAAVKLKDAQDAKAKLDRIDRDTRKPQAQR